jgi:hypothetical protein
MNRLKDKIKIKIYNKLIIQIYKSKKKKNEIQQFVNKKVKKKI